MGDPVTIGLIAGGLKTAFGIFTSFQEGNARAAAAEFERAQYEDQRNLAAIQAADEEADRMRRLQRVLASNKASAAGMGIGTEGRSFLAIEDASKEEASRDIGRIRLNAAYTNRNLSLSAQQKSLEASSARSGIVSGVATSLLGNASSAANSYLALKKA